MEEEGGRRIKRGADDLDQLEGIEKQQGRSRKARRKAKSGKKKPEKRYPLINSIEKSRKRVKNRFGSIKKPGDAIDEFGS